MTFNIFRKAIIRNSTACRYATGAGFAVEWVENDNFEGYGEFSGLTTRVVWDRNYVAVTTSGSCYIGPTIDQTPFDGGVYNFIRVVFRIEPLSDLMVPTKGKIQFQTDADPVYDEDKVVEFSVTADNVYNEYTIDMTLVKEWQGNIIRIRLYPFIDGYSGSIIHFKSLKVYSSLGGFDHTCSVGAGGSCKGVSVSDGIDIVEGSNDKLLININGYGEQGIVLIPVQGARLVDIGRDVEEKLSNIAIGGYAGNRVDVLYGRVAITADDTREAESSVVVSDTPAARTLGFYDSAGNNTSIYTPGEDASDHYVPVGTIQLSKAEIAKLYLSDPGIDSKGLRLNPRSYAVQAGRSDFADTYKEKKLDFTGKTIIDFNNPLSNNGIITSVAYTGDGGGSTEFRFFRPKADGTLTHVASVDLEILSSQIDKLFEKATSVRVRKGDLVGIYDGKLDLGKIAERPNNSYFIYDGDLKGGMSAGPFSVEGRGETGLRFFVHGRDLASEAVLDIEFEQRELIEEVVILAEEEARNEEINLSRARCGGVNGGPQIETETGYDKYNNKAAGMVNPGALTDGITHNEVGVATFHPSWEDSHFEPPDLYDQTSFSATLDFARGIPVLFNISRVVVYFRDVSNVKYFSVQYPLTTNEADTDRFFGPVANMYSDIYLHDKLLEPKTHSLYENPNHPTVEDFVHSYHFLEYSVIDLRFPSVRARTIKYIADNFYFEDDVTKETLSNYTIAPSPHILEIEVYAESNPVASIKDNFYFESSNDGENYVLHTNVNSVGSTSASYLIGYPVKYLRVHIAPQGELRLDGFMPILSRAQTRIETNKGDNFVALNFSKRDFNSHETFTVVNDGDETFNYFVNIATQKSPVERCILWNKMGSEEELSTSEIGPSASIVKRNNYYPREYNYALNAPGYMVDPFWLLNKGAKAYITYDHGITWEARGNILTDYNIDTTLDASNPKKSEYAFVYILIDLGAVYGLERAKLVYPDGESTFSGPVYGSKDTADPSDLNLAEDFYGVLSSVRWIRLRAFSQLPGDEENLPAVVSYILAPLDVRESINRRKIDWVSVPQLTNYAVGESWQLAITGITNWYAVDLGDYYNITNILLGPAHDNFGYIDDIDTQVPGQVGSAFTSSSKVNTDITYSSTCTDVPGEVRWGDLGDEPRGRDRWVLVRRVDNVRDEIIVHIEDNVQENKPCFGSELWWTARLGTVEKDIENYKESAHSISVIYAADTGPVVEEIELTQSLGIDHYLAKRDKLRLFFYVSDASQLDLTTGYFALGRNTTEDNGGNCPLEGVEKDQDNYYRWNFAGLTITTGWNELFLPFTDNYKAGRPFFTRDDIVNLSGTVLSGRSRFRWFKVNFAGVVGNTEFTINVADMKIVRTEFTSANFGNGLYLVGDEYARFPLHNFNTLEGTIEFYLNPDWTKNYWCNTCEDPRDHTIFRFFNSDGYILGAFMTGSGLVFYLSDGNKHHTLTDSSSRPITLEQNTHVAFVWNLVGEDMDAALSLYINNCLSSTFEVMGLYLGDFKPNPNATLMLGGKGWDGIIVNPRSSSVDGVIDNLKVYNYAIKDFSSSMISERLQHIRSGDELIDISVDRVNFYGSETRGTSLPLLVQNVVPGESFEVYIRNKDNLTVFPAKGQERNSFIEVVKARPG